MPLVLTEKQKAVVDADGDFLLLACPGSGKTRSAAARIAALAGSRSKVAACSYTNVGAERIAGMLAREGIHLSPKHFLGTLHGFLLRFVLYPFAHLAGAGRAAVVRGGGNWPDFAFQGDFRRRVRIDQFRRDPSGALVFAHPDRWVGRGSAEVLAAVEGQVCAIKDALFRRYGVLSADDAMWVALRILREWPEVAAAVGGRFDELLIDEAQDTSELQLACVKEIRDAGALRSLAMIGDLEQSIFSFQGASAEGCRRLAEGCGLEVTDLDENHRSSQKLCDVAFHFCARDKPDNAVGEYRACQIEPELALYPPSDPEQAMAIYRARLEHHEIACGEAAVLARSKTMIAALGGQREPVKVDPNPRAVGRLASALAAGTLDRKHLRIAQELIAYAAFDERELDQLDDRQRVAIRKAGYVFIAGLPALDGNLKDWIVEAREPLTEATAMLTETPARTAGQTLRSGAAHADFAAADVFAPPPVDLTPSTVHAIKGEDRDAVMVVVRKPHASDPAKQLELFENALEGKELAEEQQEERRITYVALTRARRYCLLALPDNDRGKGVAEKCQAIGFVPL